MEKIPYVSIVPKEFDLIEKMLDEYLDTPCKIAILDDIDFDGVSASIMVKYHLSHTHPNALVRIFNNYKHGVDEEWLERLSTFDLLIIVDSSTNEMVDLKFPIPTLILDHHELQYTEDKYYKNNVLFCNSKLTPQLENISAGMLCYLVFSEYAKKKKKALYGDRSLFDLAVSSLYSDIVPVDNYVKSIIQEFLNYEYSSVYLSEMNPFSNPILKSFILFNFVPTINCTRRLEDNASLQTYLEPSLINFVRPKMIKNKSIMADLINTMASQSKLLDSKDLIDVYDITDIIHNTHLPAKNFKGVFANKIATRNKGVIVGYFNDNNLFEFSLRTPSKNALDFLQKKQKELNNPSIVGGGHKSACGFKMPYPILKDMLNDFNKTLSKNTIEEKYLHIEDISEIERIKEIPDIAIYNEFAFSNIMPIKMYMRDLYYEPFSNKDHPKLQAYGKKFILSKGNVSITMFKKPNIGDNIIITPVLTSKGKLEEATFELIGESYMGGN